MNKIIRIIQNYLLLGLPFVVACMVWQTFQSINTTPTGIAGILWVALGINLMLWFAILIIFLIILVVSPSVREKTLTRIANIRERDEREEYITGKAARKTYISTLSLTILLLFFSIFSVKISEVPNTQGTHHKKLTVSVGVHFGLTPEPTVQQLANEDVFFEMKSIQLSQSAILFILLSFQLVMFNIAARKEQNL